MKNLIKNREWKEKNKNYLKELQLFLDYVDGIKDEELKHRVINQMLICDETLTKIAKNEIDKAYKNGYNEGKKYNCK